MTALQGAQGWSGWTAFFLLLIWIVRGAPERLRASTEAEKSLHHDQALHIESLRQENVGLRDRLTRVEDARVDDRQKCQEETDEMRATIRVLQQRVDGLVRDIAQNSHSTAHFLGGSDA